MRRRKMKAPAAERAAGARSEGMEWRHMAIPFRAFRTILLPVVTFSFGILYNSIHHGSFIPPTPIYDFFLYKWLLTIFQVDNIDC
jgi:hypothetical protein